MKHTVHCPLSFSSSTFAALVFRDLAAAQVPADWTGFLRVCPPSLLSHGLPVLLLCFLSFLLNWYWGLNANDSCTSKLPTVYRHKLAATAVAQGESLTDHCCYPGIPWQ